MPDSYVGVEYNTDSLSGTYDRLRKIFSEANFKDRTFYPSQILISPDSAQRFVRDFFGNFTTMLAASLAEGALKRANMPGRWHRFTTSELICEIVTDSSIRKGPLSNGGRLERRDKISNQCKNGSLEFAILLLPFRSPSPLKHKGVLPDIGEIYTIAMLQAISRACEAAQRTIQSICKEIRDSLTPKVRESFRDASSSTTRARPNKLGIIHRAISLHENVAPFAKDAAQVRKEISRYIDQIDGIEISDEEAFSGLIYTLWQRGIRLDSYRHFLNADVIDVKVRAIQDAGRYPCFSNISSKIIDEYRESLLEYREMLQLCEGFDLVNYPILSSSLSDYDREMRQKNFDKQVTAYTEKFEPILSKLKKCSNREIFFDCIASVDDDKSVLSLFEPILFSISHRCLTKENGRSVFTNDTEHAHFLSNVYERQTHDIIEDLRQSVIVETMRGAIEYSAAYSANIGTKNSDGFDDVSRLLPNALRMSIHRKPENVGHFSVSVSPSVSRTPWHGTAALHVHKDPDSISLSIELSADLESLGYHPVRISQPTAGELSVFSRLHRSEQPLFYISPELLKQFGSNSILELEKLGQFRLRSKS